MIRFPNEVKFNPIFRVEKQLVNGLKLDFQGKVIGIDENISIATLVCHLSTTPFHPCEF